MPPNPETKFKLSRTITQKNLRDGILKGLKTFLADFRGCINTSLCYSDTKTSCRAECSHDVITHRLLGVFRHCESGFSLPDLVTTRSESEHCKGHGTPLVHQSSLSFCTGDPSVQLTAAEMSIQVSTWAIPSISSILG